MTESFAYVGSRTTRERNARGNGINVYRVSRETSAWQQIKLLYDLVNPSFLAFDRSRRFHYAVHGDQSEISAFAIDATSGRLTALGSQSTEGRNPVHFAVDPTNRWVVVANHITSTPALLPRYDDGTFQILSALPDTFTGNSRAFEIAITTDGRFVCTSNRGYVSIAAFAINHETGAMTPTGWSLTQSKTPRFFALDASVHHILVANEDSDTIVRFERGLETGKLLFVGVAARCGSPTCVVLQNLAHRRAAAKHQ